MLRRIVDGDPLARVDITTSSNRDEALRRRALRVAALVVAFTALLEFTAAPARVGVNLFTVEAVLVGGALVALADSVRRLAVAG